MRLFALRSMSDWYQRAGVALLLMVLLPLAFVIAVWDIAVWLLQQMHGALFALPRRWPGHRKR